eukprot:2206244-Prymnesium_polylepis.1
MPTGHACSEDRSPRAPCGTPAAREREPLRVAARRSGSKWSQVKGATAGHVCRGACVLCGVGERGRGGGCGDGETFRRVGEGGLLCVLSATVRRLREERAAQNVFGPE